MRHRADFHRHSIEIDAVGEQAINYGTKGGAQILFRNMPEIQISTAMWRAATGFDLFQNCIRRDIARCVILTEIGAAVPIDELLESTIEQFAADFVTKRVPHNGIHADEPRCELTDGKKLHELHVDELGTGPQRQGVRLTAHVRRSAVARIELGETTG